ncbi:uncharacterized protein LOC136089314 isoform X1 [Hydra vulgaris]|uniref:Uncharacterized protein LOC136089314 isoform X1 n=1 Tax=Hydra vulgaris TaxID=6087 RepID=A0ABM4DAG5_HYDVU
MIKKSRSSYFKHYMRDWRNKNSQINDLLKEDKNRDKKVPSSGSTSAVSTAELSNIKKIPIETNHQKLIENIVCTKQNFKNCYSSDSDSINNFSSNYTLFDEDDCVPFDIDSSDNEKVYNSATDVNENIEIANQDVTFISFLRTWSLKHNIKTAPLNELLIYLYSVVPSLPKDNRTLKKTLRNMNIIKKAGGDFIYLTVANALLYYLTFSKDTQKSLDLTINIDGVKVYSSQCKLFWPILIKVNKSSPYLVALWYGEIKPNNVSCYPEEFIEEMKHLLNKGLQFRHLYYIIPTIMAFS